MTTIVSMDLRAHRVGDDVTSPELALVDPDLGARARACLPDPPLVPLGTRSPSPAPVAARATGSSTVLDTTVLELGRRLGRGRDARILAGCAVAGLVVVLLTALRIGGDDGPAPTESVPQAVAPLSPPSSPTPTTAPSRPVERRFVWAPTPGASAYHVEFFRDSHRVFVQDTRSPAVVVPRHWTYAGERRSLTSGRYTWYVWPVVSGKRAAAATVQASVSIPD